MWTHIFTVHAAEIRDLLQTPVCWDKTTAQPICFSRQNNGSSWPRPLTSSVKKRNLLLNQKFSVDSSQISLVDPVDLNQTVASVVSTPSNVSG